MENITELMYEKKYPEALKLLLEIEKEYFLKIQCLFEMEKYAEVVTFFNDIKDSIEDDYFEILGYYVLSCIETNNFDEALNILNDEMTVPYVQQDYLNVLNGLYDQVISQKQMYLIENNMYDDHLNNNIAIDILENEDDFDELLNVITRLDTLNVRQLLPNIQKFLLDDKPDILKTFILEILIKQQINEDIQVYKDGLTIDFNPYLNEFVKQGIEYIKVANILEERYDRNPSLLQMSLDVLDLYAYYTYPITIDDSEINDIASKIEFYVCSLNFEDLADDFYIYYHLDEDIFNQNIDEFTNLMSIIT